MQPLDVSFFDPLNTFYNLELHMWLRNNPGRTVTHFQVAELFKQAYLRAATVNNGQNGFAASGIYPLNENIFPEWMFASADVTDNDHEESSVPILPDNVGEVPLGAQNSHSSDQPVAGHSDVTNFQLNQQADVSEPVASSSKNESELSPSIADISPLPKSSKCKRTNRRKGKYGTLNGTPDIAQLKAIVANKEAADLRRSARQAKKTIVFETSSDEEPVVSEYDGNPSCIYCMGLWTHSRSKEWWLQCQVCREWCHGECIGLPKTSKYVICDICK